MDKTELMEKAIAVANGEEELSYRDLIKLFKSLGWTVPKGEGGVGNPKKAVLLEALKGCLEFMEQVGEPEPLDKPDIEEPVETATEFVDERPNWHKRRNIQL